MNNTRRSIILAATAAPLTTVSLGQVIAPPANLRVVRQGNPASLPAGVTLKPIDGGNTYYADNGFTYAANAGWDNPDFFPIGVWLAPLFEQVHANQWRDLGINYIHGITHVNPAATKSLLTANGLHAVLQDEFFRDGIEAHANVVGLIGFDEPSTTAQAWDNIQKTLNAVQDRRFWYQTYTNSQLTYGDVGGVRMPALVSSLRTTPNGTKRHIDVIATDLYWFHGASIPAWRTRGSGVYDLASMTEAQMRMGYNYNYMVQENRGWIAAGGYPAPVMNFIENGGPWIESSPYITPPELNAAVWGSIMGGARGVIYFNHSFSGPAQTNDNFGAPYYKTIQSGQTISIYHQAKATNTLIKSLAGVINSPFASGYVSVSPAPTTWNDLSGTQFDTMVKFYTRGSSSDNKFYIFAMPRYGPGTVNATATFTIKNTGATQVTVVNEGRTIALTNGGTQFVDSFANSNTVHIYRVD